MADTDIGNAFWAKIQDLYLHGDFGHDRGRLLPRDQRHPNPESSSASGSDPDFDPHPIISRVWIKAVTGDGYYHYGRSGALLEHVWVESANGNG